MFGGLLLFLLFLAMRLTPPFRWTSVAKPVVGMLHVPPLPGSPKYGGSFESVGAAVLRDAQSLVEGGVHALLLENFGDAPFYPRRVPAHTIAQLAALAAQVRRSCDLPLGINVLRNDGRAALAIAQASGAAFIRVNVLCGARLADQGILRGIAHRLLRDRAGLGASEIEIWADVDVKHSAPLAPRPLEQEVEEIIGRGGADAVIVSGHATGEAVEIDHLQSVRAAAGTTPVVIGSGLSPATLGQLAPLADAFIVGTWLKRDGNVENPVDRKRVRSLMDRYTEVTGRQDEEELAEN
jgi:membrane complex biogenesis BtpA family protein